MSTPFDTLPTLSGYADTPDENPLSNGGRWTTVYPAGVTQSLRRSTGRIQPQAEGDESYALWNQQFFTDAAVTWVIGDVGGFSLDLRLRASADGDTSYYEAHVDNLTPGMGNYEIRKRVGGGSVSVLDSDAAGPDPDTWDRIGFVVVGDELSLWQQQHLTTAPRAMTDGWTEVLTVTDTDLTSGYFVLGLGGLVAAVFQASGAALFPVDGGGGGGGDVGPAAPYFDVNIRIA